MNVGATSTGLTWKNIVAMLGKVWFESGEKDDDDADADDDDDDDDAYDSW